MHTISDDLHLTQALALARHAIGLSEPNPRVGCVLLSASGEVIGHGHTQEAGGPHAEVMALRDARGAGANTRGATAYVTLEPCSHFGRTPPCVNALIEADVSRVVIALLDPNPLVGGDGVAQLRAAGIRVDVLEPDHPCAISARELNIGFLSRMVRGRPWVRMKIAASLDGKTALDNGESKWITGDVARADGHAWRARSSAVLTGIGTVLADDPRLDVRAVDTPRQPLRVVLDSHWHMPPTARLLPEPGHVLVYGLDDAADGARGEAVRMALMEQGATVVAAPPEESGRHVDLCGVLQDLGRRGVNELHVEAGARLNAALITGGWVDEYLIYMAPRLIGPGMGLAALPPLRALADAEVLHFHDVQRVGDDLRIIARTPGRDVW